MINESLSLEQRDFIVEHMKVILNPLYLQVHTVLVDEGSFERLCQESQEAILTTPNGYERFVRDLQNNDRKGGSILAVISNFKSAIILQFGRTVLSELERDLFRFSVRPSDLENGPALNAFPMSSNYNTEQQGQYQQFDALAAYFFLHFLKFYVYNLKPDPRKFTGQDEDKK
ncbi:hypothetical protein PHOBOS_233 [Erwinia phage vB_EamM_Phobos]|uniref:hypothetical protein n=1 Tax=Erwinia phage vB_EamM_Phobos TaxID=1883377 RepID=UPI00081D0F9F|nr:hypothetical protein BIZ79_gp233 [Erwinia phage vB_EamM_Phobos]ANZ50423.1 hypothetical protein PHOBOS_233 [Erwinia phage vB_EamM_Phobos]